MPLKLRFSAKTHSDVTKWDLSTSNTVLTDANTIELCTTPVQTDICMLDYEMVDQVVQTDIMDTCMLYRCLDRFYRIMYSVNLFILTP